MASLRRTRRTISQTIWDANVLQVSDMELIHAPALQVHCANTVMHHAHPSWWFWWCLWTLYVNNAEGGHRDYTDYTGHRDCTCVIEGHANQWLGRAMDISYLKPNDHMQFYLYKPNTMMGMQANRWHGACYKSQNRNHMQFMGWNTNGVPAWACVCACMPLKAWTCNHYRQKTNVIWFKKKYMPCIAVHIRWSQKKSISLQSCLNSCSGTVHCYWNAVRRWSPLSFLNDVVCQRAQDTLAIPFPNCPHGHGAGSRFVII